MRPLQPPWLSVVVAVAFALVPLRSLAQSELSSSARENSHPSGEVFGARLRYGVVLRQGSQEDLGPGLSYDGFTPNDVALQLTWFPLDVVGLELSGQREGFSFTAPRGLEGEAGRVTSGSLIRAHAGPKARVKFGPVKLELVAGFQYAQLPAFASSSSSPQFRAGARQGVLLASRVMVDLPAGLNAQARVEYPLSLSAADGAGTSARSSGIAAGGGIGYTLGWADKVSYGVLLDYQYVSDRLDVEDGTVSAQTLQRVGAALQVDWNDAPPAPAPAPAEGAVVAGEERQLELGAKKEPPKVGALLITLTSNDGGRPIEGATVVIAGQQYVTGADGSVKVDGLTPGAVEINVAAPGFQNGNEAAQVTAGRSSSVPIALVEVQKKAPATIIGLVRSTRGGAPVAAELEIPELKLKTRADDKGAFSMRVVGGTYSVIISAKGFITQQKTVTVKEGDQAIFNVGLFPRRGR